MWIKEKEYVELKKQAEAAKQHEEMRFKLEKEVQRLADMLSAQVEDCKVGPWCNGCVHKGTDRSTVVDTSLWGSKWVQTAGEVQFCKKHLHELCPEFEGAIGPKTEGE